MKLPYLLLLGCAVTLSHQQRNYFGVNKITVDEDTAEDFSEFLMARRAYHAAHRSHQSPSSNFKPLSYPFNVHQGQNLQADQLSPLQPSPLPFFRQNVESAAVPEDYGLQARNPIARPESRPISWASLFGLTSTLDPGVDDEMARYLFNYFPSGSSSRSPFMKTLYYFTTSTATSCSFATCIPASLFADGSSTVTCRRKRRDEVRKILQDWSPSPVEKIETSEMISQDTFKTSNWTPQQFDLSSSKNEPGFGAELPNIKMSPGRSKRLLFNYFVVSTTITSYVITTKLTTKTLSEIAGNSDLECRPSGVAICQ